MTLLFEIVGILVLAGGARALFPAGSPPLPTAIAVIAVAIAGAAFWFQGYPALRTLLDEHGANEGLTAIQANADAGGSFPADQGFLEWAARHLPLNARVYLACAGHCPAEWVTFSLAPRVFVTKPSQAQYALFYDVAPSSAPYANHKLLDVFAPNNSSGDADFVEGQEAIATLR
jgi:hypothetical protein